MSYAGSASIATGNPAPYYTTTSSSTSFVFDRANVLEIGYLPAGGGASDSVVIEPEWFLDAAPPIGLALVTNGAAFQFAGAVHFARDGALFRGWNPATGAATACGSVSTEGAIAFTSVPAGGSNGVTWANLAHDARGGLDVLAGVFRVPVAPIASGNFQLQAGVETATANSGDVLSGDFGGLVDAPRGIVVWEVTGLGPLVTDGVPIRADELTYNAVYQQYVPLDESLLGLSTARLPADGKVPIFRTGGNAFIHNTLTTVLPNPLTKDLAYSLGRERIRAVTVRTVAGVKVSGALYTVDFDAGEITFPLASDLTGLDQPFTVHHRIQDDILVQKADISGAIDVVAGLTHNYPADTSYVSSKLRKGDLFARTFLSIEQVTWTGVWSDLAIGSAPSANYNDIDFPWIVTNRGAITERWAIIFQTTTTVRIIGESVGQVADGVSILSEITVINPQTGVPYFTIPLLGWGTGWSVGNVVRRNTAAGGAPSWFCRTTLQGPATVASDSATLAFISDVDTP